MSKLMRTILIALCFTSLSGCSSTTGNTNRFAIYLVAVPNTDINQIILEDKPVLTAADIVSYDWNTHTMELTDGGLHSIPAPPKEVGVYGKPFVVVADGQRCYLGAFWATFSSLAYPGPVIELPLDTKTNSVIIRRAYPFETLDMKSDPRTDKRIFKVLSELHKLKQEDWTILFDGRDVSQWRGINSDTFPDKGWIVKDGVLFTDPNSNVHGDIITRKQYSDFELALEFKLTEKANSGIKYFVVESLSGGGKSGIGLEYQILDDDRHPDAKAGKNGNRTNGSLYDLIAAPADKPVKPIGEWNTARIIAKENTIEHWLNGKRIVEYKRDDPAFRKLVTESKYKGYPDFGLAEKGHILLQYHGDKVYFRNIRIRELQ
jgi:hypothetical protein